jgi:hypothetical protein
MNRLIILIGVCFGINSVYACRYDTDCQGFGKCVISYGNFGVCVGGTNPGNAGDQVPIYNPSNGGDTIGKSCIYDFQCGVMGRRCVKSGDSFKGVCY